MLIKIMTLWGMASKLRDGEIKTDDVLIINWADKESYQLDEQSNMTFEQMLEWFGNNAVIALVRTVM